MQFNILVTGGLYSSQSGYTAVQFCRSAMAAGHVVSHVFFYQDGVTQATGLSLPLADEFDASTNWVSFAEDSGADLVVCVSAGERRGVLNSEQAAEHGVAQFNLHPRFRVEGLGALHDASLTADRTVTFK